MCIKVIGEMVRSMEKDVQNGCQIPKMIKQKQLELLEMEFYTVTTALFIIEMGRNTLELSGMTCLQASVNFSIPTED